MIVIEEARRLLAIGIEAGFRLARNGPAFRIAVAPRRHTAPMQMHDGTDLRDIFARAMNRVVDREEVFQG